MISTRTPVADIADHERASALRLDLEHLTSDAGAKLLRALDAGLLRKVSAPNPQAIWRAPGIERPRAAEESPRHSGSRRRHTLECGVCHLGASCLWLGRRGLPFPDSCMQLSRADSCACIIGGLVGALALPRRTFNRYRCRRAFKNSSRLATSPTQLYARALEPPSMPLVLRGLLASADIA